MDIKIVSPGEALVVVIGEVVVAALDYAAAVRVTMTPENRDELDKLNNRLYKRFVDLVT
jgi:hypothetical protein